MNIGAVIACAGWGHRLGKIDKPFLKIQGQPLFLHSVSAFAALSSIAQVALVLRREHLERARKLIKSKKLILVEGGKLRSDSVRQGIKALSKKIDHVLIHDGARPIVSAALIKRVISALKDHPAVICALPVRDTIKLVNHSVVKRTLPREDLFYVQTPQGFKRGLLASVHKRFPRRGAYDEAQLVELAGGRVKVVAGDITNIKITYREDVKLARKLLRR